MVMDVVQTPWMSRFLGRRCSRPLLVLYALLVSPQALGVWTRIVAELAAKIVHDAGSQVGDALSVGLRDEVFIERGLILAGTFAVVTVEFFGRHALRPEASVVGLPRGTHLGSWDGIRWETLIDRLNRGFESLRIFGFAALVRLLLAPRVVFRILSCLARGVVLVRLLDALRIHGSLASFELLASLIASDTPVLFVLGVQ